MAYEPTEWVCGETITADKLNKLERGIQEIMSDYVPTEWQCGDVITAEKLNKLEQAVADFECGSSDLSTAEVTFINSADSTKYLVTFPECDDAGGGSALILSQREIIGGTPVTVTIPLYKGLMVLDVRYYLQSTDQGVTPTFSGNVSLSGPYILITGDGSITFAGTGGVN